MENQAKRNKIETLINKHLTTKKGGIKQGYLPVLTFLHNPKKTYLYSWSGSFRHLTLRNLEGNIVNGLELLGIEFYTLNDAPRGGITGTYIILTPKGKRQVRNWKKFKEKI